MWVCNSVLSLELSWMCGLKTYKTSISAPWKKPCKTKKSQHFSSLPLGDFVLQDNLSHTGPLLMSSHGFLSISPSRVRSRGGRAMWEMKRGLCFPAERKSWSLGSGELLLFCTSLIIFPLRACLCLHIFPPSIVPKETELMRMLLAKYPHILQWLSSSRWVGTEAQSQHPTFSHAHF